MRKVIAIIIAVVVVVYIARSGALRKAPSTTTATNSPSPTSIPDSSRPKQGQGEAPAQPSPLAPGVTRASDPAVAAAIDELLKAWEPVRSVYATVETKIPDAAGHKGNTKGHGRYWIQKKGEIVQIHFDLRNELHIKQEDGMLITAEELVTVIDGNYLYKFINQPLHKEATKNKLDYNEVLQIGGPYLFDDLVRNNKLTLLPEEMKNGRAIKVIKATPNDGSRESIHSFDKANGLRLEMTELDEKGQPALQIVLVDITINPEISEDQFKPVIPEGVTVEDQSK